MTDFMSFCTPCSFCSSFLAAVCLPLVTAFAAFSWLASACKHNHKTTSVFLLLTLYSARTASSQKAASSNRETRFSRAHTEHGMMSMHVGTG